MNNTLGSSQGSFRISGIHSSKLLLQFHSGIHELSNNASIINCPEPCMFYKCLIRYVQWTPKGETPGRDKEENIASNYFSASSLYPERHFMVLPFKKRIQWTESQTGMKRLWCPLLSMCFFSRPFSFLIFPHMLKWTRDNPILYKNWKCLRKINLLLLIYSRLISHGKLGNVL